MAATKKQRRETTTGYTVVIRRKDGSEFVSCGKPWFFSYNHADARRHRKELIEHGFNVARIQRVRVVMETV